MYSSLQQQCLIELGVVPYDLNDNYRQDNTVNNNSITPELLADKSFTAEPLTSVATTKISSLLTSNSNKPVKVEKPEKTSVEPTSVVDYWTQCSPNFVADLKVVFPNINLSVKAFDSVVAQLSEHAFWKIAPKLQAQYVQLESVANSTVITSPLPSDLTVSQKKELWLLLQPYIAQD